MSGRVPESCPELFSGRHDYMQGETFYTIAEDNKVKVEDLMAANPHLPDPKDLRPGDVLCVINKGRRAPESCPEQCLNHYTVMKGDVPEKIAKRYRITVEELAAYNAEHIYDINWIWPGDILCVP